MLAGVVVVEVMVVVVVVVNSFLTVTGKFPFMIETLLYGSCERQSKLKARRGIGNKGNFESGQNKSGVCSYIPPRWPSGKASVSRAEDPGFESSLGQDYFGVESYQ